MRRTAAVVLAAALAMGASPGAVPTGGETSPALRFNPFARPELSRAADEDEDEAEGRAAPEWAPILTATLVSGSDSMVNLGGSILRVGEESHGYRLVKVRHWEAEFERGGKTVVLTVDPPSER